MGHFRHQMAFSAFRAETILVRQKMNILCEPHETVPFVRVRLRCCGLSHALALHSDGISDAVDLLHFQGHAQPFFHIPQANGLF